MRLNKKGQRSRHGSDECGETINGTLLPIQLNEMVEDFLLRTRRLMLVGEIDEFVSANICSHLQMLSSSKAPIYLYINSPGGCMSSGYAIVDQMLACRAPVYTIVRGLAYSMGAIIAAYGQKGHRYSTPNSSLMLHSMIVQSPPDQIEKQTAMVKYVQDDYNRKIANIIKRMKITSKQLKVMMRNTQWMSPKQAMKIGLIDGIWTPRMEQSLNKEPKE